MNDIYLQHHGVKGMKWGVRKKTSSKKVDKQKREKEIQSIMKANKRWYKDAEKRYKASKDKEERKALSKELNKHMFRVRDYGEYGAARIQYRMKNQKMSELKATSLEIGEKVASACLASAVGTVILGAWVKEYELRLRR